jgi:hypoxanthine phosphoribosyltransferase
MSEIKVLFTREQIATRVAEMGEQITKDFTGQTIIFVGILKGACIFLSDLARSVQLDATFDFISCSSYGKGARSIGEVKLIKDLDQSVQDKNVILVEDILDTGLTLSYLKKLLSAHQPRAMKVAALLDKPSRRVQPVKADYTGFEIPDHFVIGYGMDYAERYRNLPSIGILPPELF